MDDDLALLQARKAANIFRYAEDRSGSCDFQPLFLSDILDDLYRNALEITLNTTPVIYTLLSDTCSALRVPKTAVQAFVRDYPFFQAISYFSDNRRNVLVLSSRLVNLLNHDELRFVIGHEIGHFLLQHGSSSPSEKDPEYFVYQRAQEISADRIGLIACSNADAACRALMKIASGLHDEFLSDSSSEYIGQLERGELLAGEKWDVTHPSSVVRAAVLKQFSQSIGDQDYSEVTSTKVASIDNGLQLRISSWVNPNFIAASMDAVSELQMWQYLQQEVRGGAFSRGAQKKFSAKFGDDKLKKLVQLFATMSRGEVKHYVSTRVKKVLHRNR